MDEDITRRLEEESELLRRSGCVRSAEVSPARKTIRIKLPVQFPSSFAGESVSPTGVHAEENVDLVFSDAYPFKAPEMRLRQDFPKTFPHINPNKEFVVPCVVDGSADDFIQQPAGLSGLVFQLAVWLAKAATGELIDPNQGWEPMRNDQDSAPIVLPVEDMLLRAEKCHSTGLFSLPGVATFGHCSFNTSEPCVFILRQAPATETEINGVVLIPPPDTISNHYVPNTIDDYRSFAQFVRQQIPSLADVILDEIRKQHSRTATAKSKHFLVVLGIRRPLRVIGTESDVEFVPVLFSLRACKNTCPNLSKKSPAVVLRPMFGATPALLRRLSGTNSGCRGRIWQIGCGSLGSKIALHLMRNGAGQFGFVDNKLFLPYHNARHALSSWMPEAKGTMMYRTALEMGITGCCRSHDIMEALRQSRPEDILVDSTASLAVRNLLAGRSFSGRLVHTALYEKGTRGIVLVEGDARNPRIDDLFLSLLWKSVESDDFPMRFTNNDTENIVVGQGCGNLTTIMSDGRISLFAAGMAGKIQRMLEGSFPANGRSEIGESDDGESISWNIVETGRTVCLPTRKDGYQVRILHEAAEEMRLRGAAAAPNETGGSLLGHVDGNTRTITVLSFFPPPRDSVSTPSRFELKDREHRSRLEELEERSGGLISYLGTWHSHPRGGGPSSTDMETYGIHVKLRHPVPSVCLVVAGDTIMECAMG